MRGSIGSMSSGLTLVESLPVRNAFIGSSRPGSRPFILAICSPRFVPGVCDGASKVVSCLAMLLLLVNSSFHHAEHRRVSRFEQFTVAQKHMNAARETRIETAHPAPEVEAFEIAGAVLFEDRRVLYGVFVRAGCAVDVPRRCIPRRRRIGMVVGGLTVANHEVGRQQ